MFPSRSLLFFFPRQGLYILGLLSIASLSSCKTLTKASHLKETPSDSSTLSDQDLAEAMKIIGIKQAQGQQFCAGACHGGTNWHGLTQDEILHAWLPNTRKMKLCLEAAGNAVKKIDCFSSGGEFTSDSIKSLGVYRAGAPTSFFKNMFTEAFGENSQRYQEFMNGKSSTPPAQMPVPAADLSGEHLSEEQFALVIKVFTHEEAETKIGSFFGQRLHINEDCKAEITEELKEHIREMHTGGWQAELSSTPDLRRQFFACKYSRTDFDPIKSPIEQCFTGSDRDQQNFDFPWAADWDNVLDPFDGRTIKQSIRVLSDLHGCKTTYWMRSSADGRFIGNGSRGCSSPGVLPESARGFIADLKTNKLIGVDAPYDPGFCPDNSCFTFISGRAIFCRQELLMEAPDGSQASMLALNAPENAAFCTASNLGVYQHIGAALDGVRYVVVRTQRYSNDDGGTAQHRTDPSVQPFAMNESWVDLYKMCKDQKCGTGINQSIAAPQGTPFGLTDMVRIPVAFEGDFGISPSSRLLSSRIARKDGQGQVGYRLRKYDIDSAVPSTRELATICMKGGKASLSFDERFMVTHHYTEAKDFEEINASRRPSQKFTGPDDPNFIALLNNSSNIWMTDLWTGKSFRITGMNKGQFALYPHFRADGWMYFMVRDFEQDKHFVVASDAALRWALKYPLTNK